MIPEKEWGIELDPQKQEISTLTFIKLFIFS